MRKRIMAAFAALGICVCAIAATPAKYPGGDAAMQEFIKTHLQYPAEARESGIEGVVNVGFIVNTDGSIGTIKILRMIDPDLEQEAIRIIKIMPKWEPATDNGQAVSSEAKVAIDFHLSE